MTLDAGNIAGMTNPNQQIGGHQGLGMAQGVLNQARQRGEERRDRKRSSDNQKVYFENLAELERVKSAHRRGEMADKYNHEDRALMRAHGGTEEDVMGATTTDENGDEVRTGGKGHTALQIEKMRSAIQIVDPESGKTLGEQGFTVPTAHGPIKANGFMFPAGGPAGAQGGPADGPAFGPTSDSPEAPAAKENLKRSSAFEGQLISQEGEGVQVKQKKVTLKDIETRKKQAASGEPLISDKQRDMLAAADLNPAGSRPTDMRSRQWNAVPRGDKSGETRLQQLERERTGITAPAGTTTIPGAGEDTPENIKARQKAAADVLNPTRKRKPAKKAAAGNELDEKTGPVNAAGSDHNGKSNPMPKPVF